MSSKRSQTFLFSTAGIAAMLVIVVALNYIFNLVSFRADLTAEKLYTLSDGTRSILQELDTPVEVRFYATRDDRVMPLPLKNYARQVEALLKEYAQLADGNLIIRKLDPEPDSDAEDSAMVDGLSPQQINFGEQVYLGISVSMLDEKATLPFLPPSREQLLEYDLTRAIAQVMKEDKPKIGIMSSLPVFGMQVNPMMMRMGQMQGQPAWAFVNELKRDFEVEEVPMSGESVPDDISVLLVVHPKAVTDETQFAIDQFVLRGGNLVALVDPNAMVDQQQQGGNQMMPQNSSSNLEKLFAAWGYSMDTSKVVADMTFARELSFQRGRPPELYPGFMFVNANGINSEDVATSQLDDLWIPYAGAFQGQPAAGLDATVLVHSTENAQLAEAFMATLAPSQIAKDFKSENTEYAVALRLTGRFKTAFPEGKPAAESDEPEVGDDTTTEPAMEDTLSESQEDGAVVLVGDIDFIADDFAVQQILPGLYQPRNGNLGLMQSLVEQLAGDSRLIGVRSRATMNRPFTRIDEMQEKAAADYRQRIADMEAERQRTQQRISELQTSQSGESQQLVLSPAQQQELRDYQQKLIETNKELKQLRRDLNRDIDAMENRLKFLNIAGMPALVVVAGIAVAFTKRKRTAAK